MNLTLLISPIIVQNLSYTLYKLPLLHEPTSKKFYDLSFGHKKKEVLRSKNLVECYKARTFYAVLGGVSLFKAYSLRKAVDEFTRTMFKPILK